jgi:adenosylcobinamide kinase/adenosylcobinamide-phosphate guanylyltransferase
MPSVRQPASRSTNTKGSLQSKGSRSQGKQKKNIKESKLIFVLGGARSGKSSFALQQGKLQSPCAFLATAEPFDTEMAGRIQKHRQSRGRGWVTFEVPIQLTEWFAADGAKYSSVVVDCLTLWLNNLLRDKVGARQIPSHVRKLLKAIRACPSQVVMVSNELGLGLVPGDAGSRKFRDLAGRMNQLVAAEADEVHFLVSGLSLRLK